MIREKYDLRLYEKQLKNRSRNRVSMSAHSPEVTRGHFWSRFKLRRENKSDSRFKDVERGRKPAVEPSDKTAKLAILMLQRERLPLLRAANYSNREILERAMKVLTPETKTILQMASRGDARGVWLAETAWNLYQKSLDTPRQRTDAAFATANGLRYPGDAVGWTMPSPHSYSVKNLEFNALEEFRIEQSRQRFSSASSTRMVVRFRGESTYVRV